MDDLPQDEGTFEFIYTFSFIYILKEIFSVDVPGDEVGVGLGFYFFLLFDDLGIDDAHHLVFIVDELHDPIGELFGFYHFEDIYSIYFLLDALVEGREVASPNDFAHIIFHEESIRFIGFEDGQPLFLLTCGFEVEN